MRTLCLLLGVLAELPENLPESLRGLEAAGQVTFEPYDPLRTPRERPGLTLFEIDVDRKFTYRWRIDSSRNGRRMKAELTMTTVEVRVRHRILLPSGRSLDDRAHRALVFHEFDHVAISADPRLKQLLEDRLRRPIRVERAIEPGQPSLEDWLEQVHREDLDRAIQGITELVRHHYEHLDRLTAHGLKPLPDRDAFLAALYTPETLRGARYELADKPTQER